MLNADKVLLVHPLGYAAGAAGRDISRIANLMPPIGLASITSYLGRQGIKAEIIDCFARPDSTTRIREYLINENPLFMGVSCTTSSFLDGVRISRFAKALVPGLKIVFGGPHVSALKEKVLQEYSEIDFCVAGEGEETLSELICSGGETASSVKGLVYRPTAGEIGFTGSRPGGVDLDSLPFPAYEKLDGFPHLYMLPLFDYPRSPNTSCISSRGCPYSCSYCDRSVFGRSFRWNSAEYLHEHLQYLRKRFGIRHVNFYDDNFTFNRKRVLDFCRMMIDRPPGVSFNCAVRAEHIDRELLGLMKDAGCWMISLGIETGDEDLLAIHRQNPNLELLSERIRLIKSAGIRTKGLLMMGLPGESVASIRRSMKYFFSLPIDTLNLTKFTPFPGSPLYSRIREFGFFNEDWDKMDCMHFLFIAKGMDKAMLEKSFIYFYKRHFLRARTLWNYVAMLWRSPQSWLRFVVNFRNFLRFAFTDKRIG